MHDAELSDLQYSQDPHCNSDCANIQHVASKKYNMYVFHTETEGVHAVVVDVLLPLFSPPFFLFCTLPVTLTWKTYIQ